MDTTDQALKVNARMRQDSELATDLTSSSVSEISSAMAMRVSYSNRCRLANNAHRRPKNGAQFIFVGRLGKMYELLAVRSTVDTENVHLYSDKTCWLLILGDCCQGNGSGREALGRVRDRTKNWQVREVGNLRCTSQGGIEYGCSFPKSQALSPISGKKEADGKRSIVLPWHDN